jgi:hypothetical protein
VSIDNISDLAALIVKPKQACRMLNCGNTRLYELIGAGELDSFLDGCSRKITVESIHRYIQRQLAEQHHRTGKQTNRSKRRAYHHRIVLSNADQVDQPEAGRDHRST